MRARIVLTGLIITAGAACSAPAADPIIDEAADEPQAAPDLAFTRQSDAVPVASALEAPRPEPAPLPERDKPSPEPADIPEPAVAPIGKAIEGDTGLTPEPVAVVSSHVHPKAADPELTAEGEAIDGPAEGGGKPRGVSTGLGPVPDRGWGDPTIMDDPNPLPAGIGVAGRGGAVIIRGGAGGVDDDCAIHPRGGVIATATPRGPEALVNDRGPRGGSIGARAPRTSSRPSIPRGGGFPRGGFR